MKAQGPSRQTKKTRRQDGPVPSAAPKQQASSGRPAWLVPLAFAVWLVVGGIAIYSSTLPGAFVLDDFDLSEAGSAVRRSDNVGDPLAQIYSLILTRRPLLIASYMLNRRISGYDAFGFHITNILLHIINALLIWGLLSTLRRNGHLDQAIPESLRTVWVYAIPLLFLASPLQTESVAYISSRSEALSTMFVLGSLWAFLSLMRERRPWLNALLVAFLFGCAVLSKQDKVALVAVLPLADYLLLSKLEWRALAKNWRVYSLFLVGAVGGYFLVIKPLLYSPSAGFNLPWAEYVFTQFRMYFLYFRLIAFPFGLNADYDIQPSATLLDHFSWLSLLGLLAIGAATIYYHRRFPVICFGVGFFFLLLAPTSSFFPIADFAAERRLYLPVLGILIAACTAIATFVRPHPLKVWAAVAALTAVYAVGTYQRAAIWADPIALWQDTVTKSPRKERPWSWLGKVYNDAGLYAQAVQAWEEGEKYVEEGSPAQAHLLNNLGLGYANLGDRERAIQYYEKAVAILPGVAQFWANLAVAQLRDGRDEEGWESFERAVQTAIRRRDLQPGVFRLRGQEYYQRGRYAEAKQDFEMVVRMTPENADAIRNLRAVEAMLAREGGQ
ncbi:MAG: tetratricopeptide repeat protein [Acidobacteria bacterium]|nr:tetratricopeptide repeat protein [Acidobacteriota bacterium]